MGTGKHKKHKNPPAEVLHSTLNGSSIAMEKLLLFYEPYINKLSTMYVTDSSGSVVSSYLDEDRKQIISIAFIKGVRNFAKLLTP